MAANVHVADVGTKFLPRFLDENDAVINISAATVKRLFLKKPDGTVLTKTLTFYTDGTDGIGQYVSIAGDLDVAGAWSAEGYVEIPSGKWHSEIYAFPVKGNLG